MVSLPDALYVLFPTADPFRDYSLSDDGSGPRITAWYLTDPQPTPEQLSAVTDEQVIEARVARTLNAAGAILTTSGAADHVAIRSADVAEWTFGRNDVAECMWAIAQIICDRAGILRPTTLEIANRITENRRSVPVDPQSPEPLGVAERGKRRLTESEIVELIASVLSSGGGLPLV